MLQWMIRNKSFSAVHVLYYCLSTRGRHASVSGV